MKPVADILQEIRPEFDFSTSVDYVGDGLLDSFDMLLLVASLEKHYAISIPGIDIVPENFVNRGAIQSLLRTHGVQL